MNFKCIACAETKPITAFAVQKATTRGHRTKCKLCTNATKSANRKADTEKANAYSRMYRATRAETVRAANRRYKQDNKEKASTYAKEFRAANYEAMITKERARAAAKPWKRAENGALHKARKLNAVPCWADLRQIEETYVLANAWNSIWPDDPVHVDHVIPLQSDVVCGLHVHNNLQILRAADNIRKGSSLV